MTHNQLNEYIEHYLDKDKTQSAIMLTGAWGSGKSYYIKHNLIPYLKAQSKDCVVVSLYGINDLNDISKAIYMELRSIKLFKSTEATETAKIVGKTVLKSVAQFVPILNVNTEISKDDLQSLYESVDLTGKLIVFEDIERSHIDIIEFLGYVNNFVEQDEVKVLLVANEEEIFKSDKSKKYNQIKEKTVNDTLNYNSNLKEALANITSLYDILKSYIDVESTDFNELVKIVSITGGNLRSFIYACQKADDILFKCGNIDNELVKIIIFSIVKYSMKYKKTNSYDDKSNDEDYPLFKSCKNYLSDHMLTESNIASLKSDYESYKKQQELVKANEDVNSLKNYYVKTEDEVLQIIQKVENGLKNNNIELLIYGELAKLVLKVANIIDYNTEKIEQYITDNLKGKLNEVDIEDFFIKDIPFFDNEPSEQYMKLKEKMIISLNSQKTTGWGAFNYTPKNIAQFYEYTFQSNWSDELRDTLADDLDVEKFVEMLSKCSSAEVDKVRSLFWTIYRNTNNRILYTEKNNDSLKKLYEKVEELSNQNGFDKIIKHQLEIFTGNLKIFTGEIEYRH